MSKTNDAKSCNNELEINRHSYSVRLATELNVLAAVVFYTLVHWVHHNQKTNTNYYNGYYWTYLSLNKFVTIFPYATSMQIRTTLSNLEKSGYILSRVDEDVKDHPKYYTVTAKGKSFHNSLAGTKNEFHLFNVSIACAYGITAAVLFENIYHWVEYNQMADEHFKDGKYWAYNTQKSMLDYFPYISKPTMQKHLQFLEDVEIIKVERVKAFSTKGAWYSITHKGFSIYNDLDFDESKEITHESKKITHESKEITHESKKITHESKEITHESKEITHESKEITHESKEITNESKEITTKDISSKDISSKDISSKDISSEDIASEDIILTANEDLRAEMPLNNRIVGMCRKALNRDFRYSEKQIVRDLIENQTPIEVLELAIRDNEFRGTALNVAHIAASIKAWADAGCTTPTDIERFILVNHSRNIETKFGTGSQAAAKTTEINCREAVKEIERAYSYQQYHQMRLAYDTAIDSGLPIDKYLKDQVKMALSAISKTTHKIEGFPRTWLNFVNATLTRIYKAGDYEYLREKYVSFVKSRPDENINLEDYVSEEILSVIKAS